LRALLLAFRNGGPGRFDFEGAVEGHRFGGGAGGSAAGERFSPTRGRFSRTRDRFSFTGSAEGGLGGGGGHAIASEGVAIDVPPLAGATAAVPAASACGPDALPWL
jgi:hypothetical protein